LVIIIAFLLIGVIILPSTTGIFSRNNIFLKENDNMFQNIEITHICQYGGGFSKTIIPSISPVYGERPILLVLIEFLDQTHSPNHDFDYFNDIVWNGVTSVVDYFLEVSYGQFTFTKAGILGWYSSSRCRIDEWEDNFVEISQEAFEIASQDQSFNFSQFDKNDDQIITYDELSIIIVSSGTQYQPSFAYYVRDSIKNIITWDGVFLDGECCFVSERWDWSSYAHELGHSLGLPDLYDYSFVDVTGDSYGVGPYDIMCSTYHKSHFSAWCKIRLGWIEPVIVENDGYYEVHDVETHPEVYLLPVPYRDSEEYFLVENRWRGIHYDLQLPDQGIVIWHIDDSRLGEYWGGTAPRPNNNNNDETHKLVDVECADNPSSHFVNADDFDAMRNWGDKYDLWDKNEYSFTDTSTPCNARLYNNSPSNVIIQVLSEPGPTMVVYFSVNESPSENLPPNTPKKPSGPSSGKINEEHTFTTSSTDPDGDQIYYEFAWGDGTTSDWFGPYNSGEEVSAYHKWSKQGAYKVKVKAKDTKFAVSEWSDPLSVSMSRKRATQRLFLKFLENFFEKYPNAFPILRGLLEI